MQSSHTEEYRGRIAPTPTGYLHLGHARTFGVAAERARRHGGTLIFRIEDLDPDRCKTEFSEAAMEDLRWLGIEWDEGPNGNEPHGPYRQSNRLSFYLEIWRRLKECGAIYPSPHSRKDIEQAVQAPHEDSDESIFPVEFRPPAGTGMSSVEPGEMNWRFRAPDGTPIAFRDQHLGAQSFTAGVDFGDFLIWRRDGVPSYELAVVADDHAMKISEVVRGADLLKSTARQILLYHALGWNPPRWFHVPLMRDEFGRRLAKRHQSLSLRTLRQNGTSPEALWHQHVASFLATDAFENSTSID